MSITIRQYREAGAALARWPNVLLLTHERPDGDALGCLVALSRLLRQAGHHTTAALFDTELPRYRRILDHAEWVAWEQLEAETAISRYDGIVVADTCTTQQMRPARAHLGARTADILVIDHHVTREALGAIQLIDEQASSASLMVAELAGALNWHIDLQTAEALFTGMATDTGWFRFSNTDARTLRAAADLLGHGIQPAELFQAYYMSDSPARLRLLGRLLSEMTLHAQDRVAVLCITQDLLDACGATTADTEELVNEALRVGAVESSLLFSEMNDGMIKVSLRSKARLDCAAIAARLGGGGHRRAAGVRLAGSLQEVRDQVLQLVLSAL